MQNVVVYVFDNFEPMSFNLCRPKIYLYVFLFFFRNIISEESVKSLIVAPILRKWHKLPKWKANVFISGQTLLFNIHHFLDFLSISQPPHYLLSIVIETAK